MTHLPALAPEPGERGRASADLPGMLAATVAAWDALIAEVSHIPLSVVGRHKKRTAARTLVVLGSWPEGRPLAAIRADALSGITTAAPLDAIEDRIITAHVHDSAEEILASLERARDDVATWAASPNLDQEALLPVGGPLGVVPLATLVAATSYQCAVAALDLAPLGVRASNELLAAGLASLVDTVGAVAVQQEGAITLLALTPQLRIGTATDGPDWCTRQVDDEMPGPALVCSAGLLLDIASGRASATAAYARGEVQARDLGGLVTVAQVLAGAPGLPGTEGLRTALQAYTASAQAAQRVGNALGSAWRRLAGN